MYNQVVFDFDDDDNNPRYSIRHEVGEDAPQDNTGVLIDSTFAEQKGIALDSHCFPTAESLEAWHRKHNPQLFTE
jgi:hypothetical protein